MPHCRRKNATPILDKVLTYGDYPIIPKQAGTKPNALALGVHHTHYAAYWNRLTAFRTIGSRKGIRNNLNRDWLNRSALIEIAEPANNSGRRSEIVFPDLDHIRDANFVSEFLLQRYSDCTAESVPHFAGVDVLLRDLYFHAHDRNSLRIVPKPGGFLAA